MRKKSDKYAAILCTENVRDLTNVDLGARKMAGSEPCNDFCVETFIRKSIASHYSEEGLYFVHSRLDRIGQIEYRQNL